MTEHVVVEVSLVVIDWHVAADEIRRWWNGKETQLDDLVADAPKLLIGRTEVTGSERSASDGPAGRISDLVFLRGTLPEYRVPTLDRTFIGELLRCLEPLPDDVYEGISRADAEPFLRRHAGEGVLTIGPAVE